MSEDKEKFLPSQWGHEVIPVPLKKQKSLNLPPLPQTNFVMGALIGSAGTGKTMLLSQIVPAMKNLKHVLVASRIEGGDASIVYEAIEAWCEKTDKTYQFASNVEDAQKMIEDTINSKEKADRILVILDDFNEGAITTRENQYTKLANELFSKCRNHQTSVLFVVQLYSGISTVCRSCLNFMACFRQADKYSRQAMARDFASLTDTKEEVFNELHRQVSKVKHSYFIGTSDDIYLFMQGQMDKIERVEVEHSTD